jgi:hypothetical protein
MVGHPIHLTAGIVNETDSDVFECLSDVFFRVTEFCFLFDYVPFVEVNMENVYNKL